MSDLLSNNSNLRVPRGFQVLLHGLTTEILREQPKDLWEFGEKYLDSLVKIRKSTGVDPILHGVKLDERLATNTAFTDGSVDASNPEQEAAAMKIQTNYRQHSAKLKVEAMKEDEAAAKIQAGLRGYIYRQQAREEHGREAAEEELPTTGNTLTVDTVEELGKKAVKPEEATKETAKTDEPETAEGTASEPSVIGDVVKGDNSEISKTDPTGDVIKSTSKDEVDKQVGKESVGEPGAQPPADTSGKPTKAEEVTKSKESKEGGEMDSVDKAAVTIQAGYRGYKVRKDSKKPE